MSATSSDETAVLLDTANDDAPRASTASIVPRVICLGVLALAAIVLSVGAASAGNQDASFGGLEQHPRRFAHASLGDVDEADANDGGWLNARLSADEGVEHEGFGLLQAGRFPSSSGTKPGAESDAESFTTEDFPRASVEEAEDSQSWLADPKPVYESDTSLGAGTSLSSSAWTLLVEDESELWKIPVNRHGSGYRIGNVVTRRGSGWLNARAKILEQPEVYGETLLSRFLQTGAEGARAFAAVLAAHEREKGAISQSPLGQGLDRAVVMPLRLSDKVHFIERNEKLIVDAALDYRKTFCADTCDRFIISLSLVWGDDGKGDFAYKSDEYVESIRVLRSMLAYAKDTFPEDFALQFAVTSDADDTIALLALAPHLMANPLDTTSTLISLAHRVNAVIREEGQESLLAFYDAKLEPRLNHPEHVRESIDILHHLASVIGEEDLPPNDARDGRQRFPPDWFGILSRVQHWPENVQMSACASMSDGHLERVFDRRAERQIGTHDVHERPQLVNLEH